MRPEAVSPSNECAWTAHFVLHRLTGLTPGRRASCGAGSKSMKPAYSGANMHKIAALLLPQRLFSTQSKPTLQHASLPEYQTATAYPTSPHRAHAGPKSTLQLDSLFQSSRRRLISTAATTDARPPDPLQHSRLHELPYSLYIQHYPHRGQAGVHEYADTLCRHST